MKAIGTRILLSALATFGAFSALGAPEAQAQGYNSGGYYGGGGGYGYGGGGYYAGGGGYYGGGGGYYGGSPYVARGYGGGYAAPSDQYYGNGGHDYQPHWHTKQTPYGSYTYFGVDPNEFRPHAHVETPGGITSYSSDGYSTTQSYSPPAYVYRPW